MATITLYGNRSAQVFYSDKTRNDSSSSLSSLVSSASPVYVGFESLPSQYLYKSISASRIYFTLNSDDSNIKGLSLYNVTSEWNESTVNYNTKPNSYSSYFGYFVEQMRGDDESWVYIASANVDIVRKVIQYGVKCEAYYEYDGSYSYPKMYTTRAVSTKKPRLEIELSDTITNYLNPTSLSPANGYVPKYSDNTFSWSTNTAYTSIGVLTITNSLLRWRVVGSSSYQEIDCGTSTSYTIPSGTFTEDNIQWQVVITDNTGHTSESEWCTLSTAETTSTATIVSPTNTIVDTSLTNRFVWEHSISTGTSQTNADLQISNDDATWSNLISVEGSNTYADVSPNTIASGTKYWRVRTYNTDNVAGSWSDSASFIALGAPTVQGVTVDATPRPTVRWQSADMRGYQVRVGAYDSGIQYGTVYSYKLPHYLADGEYVAKVRVINIYGLWSNWIEVSFAVSNDSGETISLVAISSGHSANLRWNLSDYDEYVIYRDNIPIAKTTSESYVDYLANGEHSYFIRGIYSDADNYGISETKTVEMTTDEPIIADINVLEWLNLKLSSTNIESINFSIQSNSNLRHYSSSVLPIAELSKQKSITVSGEVAFLNNDECLAFESMIGKIVCLKLKNGTQIIGLLSSQTKRITNFFTDYSFSISQTEFNEGVEI